MRLIVLLFFIFLTIHLTSSHLNQGKITGISTLPQEVLLQEYRPKVEIIKILIVKEMEDLDKLILTIQNLHQTNILTSKNIANYRVKELRDAVTLAKGEAKYSNSNVKACINKQEFQIPRIAISSIGCNLKYNNLIEIKNKFIKLQQLTAQLLPNCQKLHMDDCESDINMMKKCLTDRIDDIYDHIKRIKDEFAVSMANVINFSLHCLIDSNFDTFKSIGEVLSSLRHCKNFATVFPGFKTDPAYT